MNAQLSVIKQASFRQKIMSRYPQLTPQKGSFAPLRMTTPPQKSNSSHCFYPAR